MGDMASTDVVKAVALIEIGTNYSDVADMLGKSKSTIYRIEKVGDKRKSM